MSDLVDGGELEDLQQYAERLEIRVADLEEENLVLEAENARMLATLASTPENINYIDRILLTHEDDLEAAARFVLEALRHRANINKGGG